MKYDLFRDGQFVLRGTHAELMEYIHRTHSYSFDHAIKYEGYSTSPVDRDDPPCEKCQAKEHEADECPYD